MSHQLIPEDSDEEFQEIQYARLQNNYRQAREDQREYTIEKKDQLRIQSKTLQQLMKERDELDKMINVTQSLENQKRDADKSKQLQQLIQTKDEIKGEIKNEKQISAELDEKIREWEKKVRQKQTEVGGANVAVTFYANVRKQERVLENRLDTTLKRFSSLLNTNSLLRSEIDNLRNERERFENLSQQAEDQLKDLRAQLVHYIEYSVASYEQRKDANTKAILLQNKAESDKQTAEAEMKELARQISHDQKLQEFMRLKAQERPEDDELVAYRRRQEIKAGEKRRKEREEHSIEAYESKFKRIQDICNEPDLNKLVTKFIEVEDKNFALFNYVNELNNQAEILQDQIDDVKKEIRRFEGQSVELEDQQKRMLENIEDQHKEATAIADDYEDKTRAIKKILDQCRAGIDSIFNKIGCDRRQIDHLLQSHEGVTEDNMLRYLGIIEERANELLIAQAAINAKEQNLSLRERAPNLIGDGPAGPIPQVQIHLPNTEERRDQDDRDEKVEDELKPLTREQLKQRAIDHVKNLEKKALLEQTKYPDLQPASREKSTTGGSRTGGGDTGKLSTTRPRQ